jgi:hypothetical protein
MISSLQSGMLTFPSMDYPSPPSHDMRIPLGRGQLDHSLLVRYLRIIADRPDGGGQPGGQMAASEIGIYGLQ